MYLTTAFPESAEEEERSQKLFHDQSPQKLRGQAGFETRDPWICSQTYYPLHYGARPHFQKWYTMKQIDREVVYQVPLENPRPWLVGVGWLVGWLVGCLAGWLVGWLVWRLIGNSWPHYTMEPGPIFRSGVQ